MQLLKETLDTSYLIYFQMEQVKHMDHMLEKYNLLAAKLKPTLYGTVFYFTWNLKIFKNNTDLKNTRVLNQ